MLSGWHDRVHCTVLATYLVVQLEQRHIRRLATKELLEDEIDPRLQDECVVHRIELDLTPLKARHIREAGSTT